MSFNTSIFYTFSLIIFISDLTLRSCRQTILKVFFSDVSYQLSVVSFSSTGIIQVCPFWVQTPLVRSRYPLCPIHSLIPRFPMSELVFVKVLFSLLHLYLTPVIFINNYSYLKLVLRFLQIGTRGPILFRLIFPLIRVFLSIYI